MNSRLYRGVVWHSRGDPAYRFQYRVWYLCLDLGEVEAVASKLRLLSHNRPNVLSFWDRDYLALESEPNAAVRVEVGRGSGGASWPREALPEHSAVPEAGYQHCPEGSTRTELITVPRILGHAFNPVSFLLTRQGGDITYARAEVHNTWGERHVYGLERQPDAGEHYEASAAKAFYVSPFLPMQGGYRFELREDAGGRLRVKIDLDDADGKPVFSGGIDVRPMAPSDANLARLLITHPFVNLKTVAMIHLQGIKLWRRGVKFRPNPSRKSTERRQLWPRGH